MATRTKATRKEVKGKRGRGSGRKAHGQKAKGKKAPRLTPMQRWKWRALEAEARAEMIESKRLRLKFDALLQQHPVVAAFYEKFLGQQTCARAAHRACADFASELAEYHGVDMEKTLVDDETGRLTPMKG